jgi:hypothetical protein
MGVEERKRGCGGRRRRVGVRGEGECHMEERGRGVGEESEPRHVTSMCRTLYLPMMIHLERMPTIGARTPGVRGGKGKERVVIV